MTGVRRYGGWLRYGFKIPVFTGMTGGGDAGMTGGVGPRLRGGFAGGVGVLGAWGFPVGEDVWGGGDCVVGGAGGFLGYARNDRGSDWIDRGGAAGVVAED